MSFLDYLFEYGHQWAVHAVILVFILLVVVFNWKRFVRFSVSNMLLIAVAIWLCGIALYSVGFTYEGTSGNFISIFFRSSLSSLKMFLADNELVEISSHYKENTTYMLLFAIIHFAAFCLAAILILNTLGARFSSYLSLLKERIICRSKAKNSYVFWDVNPASISLARDIRKHDDKARIVFLCPYTSSSLGEKLDLIQILGSNTVSHDLNSSVGESVDSVLTVYFPNVAIRGKRFVWLKKILESSINVDFFFFTDDAQVNMSKAETVPDLLNLRLHEGGKIGIYVLTNAASSYQTVAGEHLVLHNGEQGNVNWFFVNLPSIAVESLKFDIENYPVSTFPRENIKAGRVDGEFNGWMIGMGETGCGMFKLMYEFSMLEGVNSEVIKRNFLLFDKDIDAKSGYLLSSCPDVAASGCVETSDIEIGSVAFWDALKAKADTLNCISIGLGSDELDLEVARSVYRFLLHFRQNPKVKTKIFVRVYSPEYVEIFKKFALAYNGNPGEKSIEIVPFGGEDELFSVDIILKKSMMNSFKSFNHRFDSIRGKNVGLTPEECWEKDFNIKKYTAEYSDATVAMDELERRKAQCFSSTFFIGTLLKLAGVDISDKEKIDVLLAGLDGADGTTDSLVDTLIRACFLREQASHQLLGFTSCSDEYVKNQRSSAVTHKLTSYLLPWNEASDKTRKLFHDVLRTSLRVARNWKRR